MVLNINIFKNNLKIRLKKALFAFFKDEILSLVGFTEYIPKIKYIPKKMEITEIRFEILLKDDNKNMWIPINVTYEKALEEAKYKLFKEVTKHIQFDERTILSSNVYPHRIISGSLFVGVKN